MPTPKKIKANLGAKYLSPTDLRIALNKIRTNRMAHNDLVRKQGFKLQDHREHVNKSLRGIDQSDRPGIVNKSVAGLRSELVAETADVRLAYMRELKEQVDAMRAASGLYASPLHMLMRETLGSERRSRIMQQIANSGPVELASLAELAAAKKDNELAAALCSRVADLPRLDRPFSAQELADVLCGDLHKELSQAMVEADRRLLEAMNEDLEFETGRKNEQRALEIAMMKRKEAEIAAFKPDEDEGEGEDDEEETPSQDPNDRIARGLAARRNKPAPAPVKEEEAPAEETPAE